jgi:hypothetical protein
MRRRSGIERRDPVKHVLLDAERPPAHALLGLQRAAGNRATCQALAGQAPIQRVTHTARIPTASSPKVPDLPPSLVAKIETATNMRDIEDALKLVIKHVLKTPPANLTADEKMLIHEIKQRQVEVELARDWDMGGANAYTVAQDTGPIVITVNRDICASSRPKKAARTEIIYSTLRHELIHVAQRVKQPAAGAAGNTDPVFFENRDYLKHPVNQPLIDFQVNIQEIETHTWELEHAADTGIAGAEPAYVTETVTELVRVAGAITKALPTVAASVQSYLKNYLLRCVVLLGQAASATAISAQEKIDLLATQTALNTEVALIP